MLLLYVDTEGVGKDTKDVCKCYEPALSENGWLAKAHNVTPTQCCNAQQRYTSSTFAQTRFEPQIPRSGSL